MEQQNQPVAMWAVVEVLGHVRLAGWLTEQTIAGTAFVRVDVPELAAVDTVYQKREALPAFTKLIGGGSIYSITPCTEAVARRAAETFRVIPVQYVDLVKRVVADTPRLTGPAETEEEPPEDDEHEIF